jgi:hypothetical protein
MKGVEDGRLSTGFTPISTWTLTRPFKSKKTKQTTQYIALRLYKECKVISVYGQNYGFKFHLNQVQFNSNNFFVQLKDTFKMKKILL